MALHDTQAVADEVLVERAQSGEFQAFEELVTRHERWVYGVVMSIVRNREDTEDVVQNTFLKALEKIRSFRGEATFGTWLRRIATNSALNCLRSRGKLARVSLDQALHEDAEGVIRHPEYVADWGDDPARRFEQNQLRVILQTAIESLPDKYRIVFVLRDIEQLSVEETAQSLCLSPANVKVRTLRARLMLREHLTRVFGETPIAVEVPTDAGVGGETPAEQVLRSYLEHPIIQQGGSP